MARLHAETVKVVRLPEFAESLLPSGTEVFYQDTPEQGSAFMKQESIKWPKLVKDSGARIH